jgi:DNA repair exonuclease SbcCD ATPase subunit
VKEPATVLTPTRLIIRGFRGFLREQPFRFDTPTVILFGENRCGKSSTLNALEWCLFGDEVEGVKTGIRERKDWEISNRYLNPPAVSVELHFDTSDGPLIVRRTLIKAAGRGKARQVLELTSTDGEIVKDAIAEQRLKQVLKATFRDFMTMVYQHQETIRGIVMQEPRERNDAIDRLLGLSDYRNLLTAIKDADLQKRQKGAIEKQDRFGERIETLISYTATELGKKHQAVVDAGLPDGPLTDQIALRIAQDALQVLVAFAKEARLETPTLEPPHVWKGLSAFEKSAQDTIKLMRGRLPDAAEQEILIQRQTDLTGFKAKLATIKEEQEGVARSIRDLDKKHGGQQSVATQILQVTEELSAERKRLREANSRAALVREAIQYLEKAKADELAGRCPLCANEAPNLLETLRTRLEQALQGELDEIDKAIKSRSADLEKLEQAVEEYDKANKEQKRLVDVLLPLRQKTGKFLGKDLEVTDDPIAMLHTELGRVQDRLQELETAIKERQDRLTSIGDEFNKVHMICEFLELEEKKQIIDRIEESPEWQALEDEKNRIAQFVDDLEAIKTAITAASHAEANRKLSTAEKAIDEYFRLLTRQPAGKGIKLALAQDKSGKNTYEITDLEGKDLTPILSQGDMNALALAIFLGLACSSDETAVFKFVLLDDPSQSLGSDYKEQLVEVLDRVAASRRVIVATMDREFCDFLRERATRAKIMYQFARWTEQDGARAEPV